MPQCTFKRLTPDEMAEHRKQGLCYNCDEPCVHAHKCARLFYLEASDYVIEEPDDDDAVPAVTAASQPPFDPEEPLISLSAITGIRTKDTMQLRVQIDAYEFTVLLDSGSTHNFVSIPVAQRAGLCFQDSRGAYVTVANGDRIACCGLASDVALQIGEEFFTVDCYAIPLDCHDMVLGVAWLRTLGPILWDFDDLCMAFTHHGRCVLWKGIGSTRTDIPPTGRLHAACVHAARGPEPVLLERLLDAYEDVFAPPIGLPPACPCDHRIHLKPNTEPVRGAPLQVSTAPKG